MEVKFLILELSEHLPWKGAFWEKSTYMSQTDPFTHTGPRRTQWIQQYSAQGFTDEIDLSFSFLLALFLLTLWGFPKWFPNPVALSFAAVTAKNCSVFSHGEEYLEYFRLCLTAMWEMGAPNSEEQYTFQQRSQLLQESCCRTGRRNKGWGPMFYSSGSQERWVVQGRGAWKEWRELWRLQNSHLTQQMLSFGLCSSFGCSSAPLGADAGGGNLHVWHLSASFKAKPEIAFFGGRESLKVSFALH